MAKVVTDDKHYKDIANAIRECVGGDNRYKPEEMATQVHEVHDVAHSKGIDDGYTGGYNAGFTEGKDSVTIYDLAEKLEDYAGYVIYRGMGSAASGNCTEVETVRVTTIPTQAFSNFPTLEKAIIGEGTIYIRNYAFSGCGKLKQVILPNTVKSIYNVVFGNCTSLDNVYLPKSVTSINSTSFNGCTGIKTFTIESDFNCDLPLGKCSALTVESVTGIITNYKESSGKTLTVHSNVFAQLTEDVITTATNKGLTIAEA